MTARRRRDDGRGHRAGRASLGRAGHSCTTRWPRRSERGLERARRGFKREAERGRLARKDARAAGERLEAVGMLWGYPRPASW